MRTLSDEKRVGTIELLITMPVKDSEVILGKFFGALAMVTLQIALIAAFPLVMFTRAPFWHLGELDWSPFLGGNARPVPAVGSGHRHRVMWSSFTESQILSFFATMLTLILLYAIGSVTIVEFLRAGWRRDLVHQPPEPLRAVRPRDDRLARDHLLPLPHDARPRGRLPLSREPEVELKNGYGT